jgi:parallel beta-helix repeat protein
MVAMVVVTLASAAASCQDGTTVVVIKTTDDAQLVVNAAGEDAIFFFEEGVHTGVNIWPLNGQEFYGFPGAVLDGAGSTNPAFASWTTRTDVTIANLEITNYAVIQYTGVIDTRTQYWNDAEWGDDINWTIDQVHVHGNLGSGDGAGISLGSGSTLTNSVIENNAGLGIYGNGRNITIDNNVVHNNSNDASDVYYHSGGMKLVIVQDTVVSNNTVTDNFGPGVWFDINGDNNQILDNTISGNFSAGIQYELSRGATISGNHIENNGHGDVRVWMHVCAVSISTSWDITVHDNTSIDNRGGMCAFDQRTLRNAEGGQDTMPLWGRLLEPDDTLSLWRTENVAFTDNTIENSFISGASATELQSVDSNIYETTTFTGNTFVPWNNWYLGSGDDYSVDATFAEWQAAGNDP